MMIDKRCGANNPTPVRKPKQSLILAACNGEDTIGLVSGGLTRDGIADLQGEIESIYVLEKYKGLGWVKV